MKTQNGWVVIFMKTSNPLIKLNFLIIFIFMVILTSCKSLQSEDKLEMKVAVPENFFTSENESLINVSQIGWYDYFSDQQLRSLIDIALINNTDIRLASFKMQENYKLYGIEKAGLFPQLTGQSTINYSRKNEVETNRSYQLNATLEFELDLFGRLRNLTESQREKYLASVEAQRNVYMLLISQVAQAYFNEQILDKKIDIVDKQIENYEQSLALVKSRLITGESSYLDFEQANGLLESIRITKLELNQNRQLARHSLQNLVNQYDLQIQSVKDLQLSSVKMPNNLLSTNLLTRPDILQAEHTLKASNADVEIARAAFFPSITLTSSLGNTSTDLLDLINGTVLWSLVPKISLPLFTGGKNILNFDLATIRKEQAMVEYEKVVHLAFKQVADLLIQQTNLQQQLILQRNYLVSQQKATDLALQSYLNGSSSYLATLDAQRNTFSSQLALLSLQQNLFTIQVNLFIALGGGWHK